MNLPSQKQNANGGKGIFIIIAVIFLSISVWQTAQGYELMFGKELSYVFSFAIGIMMLYLSIEMRSRRTNGLSATGPLLGYIACGIFCFFGNFNALYSRYNKEELFSNELQKHRQELTAVTTKAITALKNADPESRSLEKQVTELKAQLIMQIEDPANAGVGLRANEIINGLQTTLGQQLTQFSGSAQQKAASYSSNIDNVLKARLAKSKMENADDLIHDLTIQKDSLDLIILTALKPQNISKDGQDAIFKTVDAINNTTAKTSNLLGSANFSFSTVKYENQEVGKISHTFKSAFNGENWAAAIISILVALAIDALVPFVAFVGTKNNPLSNNKDEREIYEGAEINVL